MASNSGFHTGERCRPQSRFMDCHLMCMASIVLLFQYPMVVAWTLAAPQSMECCVFCTCTAIPFLGSPVFTAYLCSVILFFIVLLVSPMYVSWQSRQGTSYTTFLFFSIGVLCSTCISMLLNVFWGLKMVFTPSGAHTFFSFSFTQKTLRRWY